MDRVRIVLDIDVVSLYRTGRLPPGFAHHVATNDLSITFATAGELWKWALARRWGGARRGGLELFSRPGADPSRQSQGGEGLG